MSENYVTEYICPDDPGLGADTVMSSPASSTNADWAPKQHAVKDLGGIDLSRIRLMAYKMTRNVSISYDIAQNVCKKLLEMPLKQRNAIVSLEAYAISAARNESLNWLRTQERNASLTEAGDLVDENADPADLVCTVDEVHQSLARLPSRLREPFILCRIYGYYAEESAVALGISVETVWKRVRRAFELLRREELKTTKSPIPSFTDSRDP
jgi:RNA polymerase sigma factor (sigma-70 family)